MNTIKLKQIICIVIIHIFFVNVATAQYKQFKIAPNGDTINKILKDGAKVGKWVINVPELRGEPGFDEEGIYKKGLKEGFWRRYNAEGDLLAVEQYLNGGKDGLQQYYTYLGDLVREENWKGYNPDAPFDTIAVYGTGNNEIIDFKIVKAEPYSVKQGEWRYYDAATGALVKKEEWVLNNLKKPETVKKEAEALAKKKEVEKTPQMIEWEKKNRGKKGVVRDGRTGM